MIWVVDADWSVRPVRRRKERSLLARVGGKQHFNGLIAQRDTVRERLAVFSASRRDVPDALFEIDFIPKRERKFLSARGVQDAEECSQTLRRLSDLTCKQSTDNVYRLIKRSGRAMPGGVDALRLWQPCVKIAAPCSWILFVVKPFTFCIGKDGLQVATHFDA